jgi:hypothetical protein
MRPTPQFVFALALAAALAPAARAQQTPVVVELFTSQGCATCPPADALLDQIAARPGVIALALHVDYWDYLGWKDAFAQPQFSDRQKAYAKSRRERSIFTPQMIVQGADPMIGHDEPAITASIAAHQARPAPVSLQLARNGSGLDIVISPAAGPVGPADVHVVEILPEHAMTIEAGENAGHSFTYSNIVTGWHTVARWDGASEVDIHAEGLDPGPVAVIVQGERMGPVLAAGRVP